ncbi:hypothetical protein QYM36_001547 [Artemia franciscana]|uniref:Signal peptidase complex subunit 3 n=2 Tax=Artemia franciscana TaxID=6661 RepID=A0AA88LKC9_ARTSF|nr:hypothetical protein QYM36_001547 [Artemia franciscana]
MMTFSTIMNCISKVQTVAFVIVALCFLQTLAEPNPVNVHINPVVANIYPQEYSEFDLGVLNLDLKTDLKPLFNWNVKQLYVYLTAEYHTKHNILNQVVLCDKIIKNRDEAKLDLKGLTVWFGDKENELRGNENIVLTLSWNLVPNIGFLPRYSGTGAKVINFPFNYKVATKLQDRRIIGKIKQYYNNGILQRLEESEGD